MALFSVKFEVLSPITSLPNSQTVFGTICTYYASMYGEKELEEILLQMEQMNFPFVVSSMYYENILPLPLNFNPKIDRTKISFEDVKTMKNLKNVKYISKKVYLQSEKNIEKLNSVILDLLSHNGVCIKNNILMLSKEITEMNLKIKNSMRTRVDVNNEQYFNNSLLYMPKKTILEFYIDIYKEEIVEKLNKLFKSMKYISFGGGKSIGYNLFSFVSMNEEKNLKSDHPSLLLSMSIGDNSIDYNKSDYKMVSVNNKFNYSYDTVYRSGVICFSEGSVINTSTNVIGKVIKEEVNSKPTYQNFVGLLI